MRFAVHKNDEKFMKKQPCLGKVWFRQRVLVLQCAIFSPESVSGSRSVSLNVVSGHSQGHVSFASNQW